MATRKPIIDPSLSNEEKVKKLSKVVERLGRRAAKQTSAIIPPIPVSNCVMGDGVEGVILRYLFPCPGHIGKGGIFLNVKPEKGATVELRIDSELGGWSRSYQITRQNLLIEPNIDIDTWNRLTISFSVTDPDKDKITEVWIAFLWTPTIKDTLIKSYLINDLDGDSDDLSKE